MHVQTLITTITLVASSLASPVSLETRAIKGTPCQKAIIYGVRGAADNKQNLDVVPSVYNNLPAEFTTIANAIKSKYGGGQLVAIDYPASSGGNFYAQSVAQGIASLQDSIYDYIGRCSTGAVFVLGYSEGAQVVTGALAGSASRGPLQGHNRITGGAAFADPTFQDNKFPVDYKNVGSTNGRNGRVPGDGSKYNFLNTNFAGRFQSYCANNDEFCDTGETSDAGDVHRRAVTQFAPLAQDYLTTLPH